MANSETIANSGDYQFFLGRLPEDDWSTVLKQFADATIYQSYAYGAVRWGERRLQHAVLTSQGKVVAAAQLVVVGMVKIGLAAAYAPAAPLWRVGPNHNDAEHLEVFVDSLAEEIARKRGFLLRLNPPEPVGQSELIEPILLGAGFEPNNQARHQTIHLDLTKDLQDLEAQLSKKWRENLRRSRRSELEIREGKDDDLFRAFVVLYREMHRRKQFAESVDVDEFREMQKRLPQNQKMQVMICSRHGVPIAGLVWSAIGDVGIPIFSATGDEGLKHRGSYLLRWTMLERMKEQNCRILDQGGVNPEKNPGGYKFKSGMGGTMVESLGRYELCVNRTVQAAVSFLEWAKRWRRRF